MKDFIIPDYKTSNLNISATLAEFLGAPNKNATLEIINKELSKNYKNIVFICFDGLGIHPIKQNLKEADFLRRNIKLTLLSTFPSTTTNATTSLMLNKLPLEHGWLGWSLYFEEINKNVDIFLQADSVTGEKIDFNNSPLADIDYYFDNAKSEYKINTIFPVYVLVKHPERNNVFNSEEEFFENIKNVCNKKDKQFVYAYYPEPDSTMHDFGVTSVEAKNVIESISKNIEEVVNQTKDTLFIISADHGQIDIKDYVALYEDEKLMDMLKIYPFLEARAPAFLVKEGREKEFEKYFTQKYGEDFILYKSSELIKKGYFGFDGDKAHLLGDYVAIGTYTHKQALLNPSSSKFKGHHTSLTEEMEVPLILINN